jgi:hypothetical protein
MRLLFILSAVTMSGCALGTGIRPAYVRDGIQIYEAKCNGLGRSISDCHAQASQACNGKYKDVGTDGSSSFVQNSYTGQIMPVNNRSLAFYCTQ